jgi:hypothetical protein
VSESEGFVIDANGVNRDNFAPAIAVVAALSLTGAIIALALPGRRQAAEPVAVGAVPALEAEGES